MPFRRHSPPQLVIAAARCGLKPGPVARFREAKFPSPMQHRNLPFEFLRSWHTIDLTISCTAHGLLTIFNLKNICKIFAAILTSTIRVENQIIAWTPAAFTNYLSLRFLFKEFARARSAKFNYYIFFYIQYYLSKKWFDYSGNTIQIK